MIVVGDASVLIALYRIGRLHLLEQLYAEVIVPEAVWREAFGVGNQSAPSWIRSRSVSALSMAAVKSRLDRGEHEAIALALESTPASCSSTSVVVEPPQRLSV